MDEVRLKQYKTIKPANSPEFDVPLRYFLTGLLFFVLFSVGLMWLSPTYFKTYDDPKIFALVHTAVLGWITMTIMGAMYQLFPVALWAEIKSMKVARWNFWLYAPAVAGFAASFYVGFTPGIALFGLLIVGGIVHFSALTIQSVKSIKNWHIMAPYTIAAQGWLIVTILFGAAYALDWYFNWFDVSPHLLAAHVSFGLAGWLSLTLMGVSYRLMELFALSQRRSYKLAYINLGLWNFALIGLGISLIFFSNTPAVRIFVTLLLASALIYTLDLLHLFMNRRRKSITLEHGFIFVSLTSLIAGGALAAFMTCTNTFPNNYLVTYGYLLIVGWLGFAVVGKYYKIIPFLTWLHRYAPKAGFKTAPLLKDLYSASLGWASFTLMTAGFSLTSFALALHVYKVLDLGTILYFFGALVVAYNLLTIVFPIKTPIRSTGVKQIEQQDT